MTQNEKDILLKDLCARLPYGVKISVNNNIEKVYYIDVLEDEIGYGSWLCFDIEEVKPYLFPMSSMTEEQKEELKSLMIEDSFGVLYHTLQSYDYLYKNHIDIRGFIDMGLAIDATNLNIY